ncbi:MAG: TetR/AcrR family transcriptional regulator [Nitrospiraceae bacterium]|nr:TetR/AcrR family transcriptional regulator [Nitrospiraceae bacterium]
MKTEPKKATPKSKSSDSYHHGDLRTALLDAAVRLLKKRGPEEISLRELARIAGVSQAAPYRHFRDKEELLAQVARQGFTIMSEQMKETILKCRANALEMFYQCGIAYFRMGSNHPQHFKLMFSAGVRPDERHPELLIAASQTLALLRDMVLFCQRHKVLGEGDPMHRALHCWSVVHGFTTLYADGRLSCVGVTADNAEKALMTLMSQQLIGAVKSLDKSDFGFTIFDTEESRRYLQGVKSIPIITESF